MLPSSSALFFYGGASSGPPSSTLALPDEASINSVMLLCPDTLRKPEQPPLDMAIQREQVEQIK